MMPCAFDLTAADRLSCLVCRPTHHVLVGYLNDLEADLARIPRELLRGRALGMVTPVPRGSALDASGVTSDPRPARGGAREAWAWLEWCHQGSYAFTPPEEPTYPPHYVAADGGRRAVVHRAGTEKNAWGMKGEPKWRSPIHMPRTASRLTLEVTDVHVERVQEITEADAIAEGCAPEPTWTSEPPAARDVFEALWGSIHGPGAWERNPWVWVLTFRVVSGAADSGPACRPSGGSLERSPP